MAYRVKVTGVHELREALRAVAPNVAKHALEPGCGAAADVFLDAMKSTVPRAEGTLEQSLTQVHPRSRSKLRQYFLIGPGPAGFYGRFLEWGTSTIAARPWMRPAFALGAQPALDACRVAVRYYLANYRP
jgi:HK97 gp10 family phage protein